MWWQGRSEGTTTRWCCVPMPLSCVLTNSPPYFLKNWKPAVFSIFLGWLVVTKGTPSRPSIGEKLRCVLSSSTTRIELTPLCIPSRLPGLIIIICSSFEDNVFLLTWSMPFFLSCMLVVFRAERLKLQIEKEVLTRFFLLRAGNAS